MISQTIGRRSVLAAAGTMAAGRARAAAPRPTRLGILTDMSGPYSISAGPGSVAAARIAVEDFGREHPDVPVELLSADAGSSVDNYVSLAGKWYGSQDVDVIMGVPLSSAALALATMAAQRDKVLLLTDPVATDLTGPACGPNHIQWVFDSYVLANSTARAIVKRGGTSWFFIQADYAMGASLTNDAAATVIKLGGKVLGTVKHPFPGTTDFANYLLQAQSSGAKVLGLTNAGTDAENTLKQVREFGLISSGMEVAATLFHVTQVHSLGLQDSQGLFLTDVFYWDLNEGTRGFSRRYAERMNGVMPASTQAGMYSAVMHYLKTAVAMEPAAAQASGRATVARMKSIPTEDPIFGQGSIRADGRKIHSSYLFQVKPPGESRQDWDYYKLIGTTPAEEAFKPMSEGGCPLVR